MPYELVTPVEGENLSRNAEEADKNWASYSDDGFLDTFLSLKKQMDFTRKQYRDQQNTLPLRKVQLRKQLIKSWFNVFLFILIIPVGLWILTDLFMKWGTTSGLASSVYLILKILLFPALFVSIFLAGPPSIRTLINTQRRYNAFFHPNSHAGYRDRFDIVSFAEEEHFLNQMLSRYAEFDERTKAEKLDQPGFGDSPLSPEEKAEKQRQILDEMQSISTFKDYQARINTHRLEGDMEWVLLGLAIGVFIGLGGFMIVLR